jgi:serine/threonine protein kinase
MTTLVQRVKVAKGINHFFLDALVSLKDTQQTLTFTAPFVARNPSELLQGGTRKQETPMPVQVVCPNPKCRKTIAIKDELAGQALRCPACKTNLSGSSHEAPPARKPSKGSSTIQCSSEPKTTSVTPPVWPSPTQTAPGPAAPIPPKTGRGGQHEELPETIGPYQVSRVLGRGAFGVVYQGHDARLKRDVAIKVLNRNALHSTKAIERFLREAQVVAQMHHNHIVPVYELGEHDGCHYIASRFVPGTTLSDLIPEGGLDPVQAVALVLQLLEALVYAHKMNVLHRDVKPANAIVDGEGQLSLMDFGLAGWVGQMEEGRATQDGTVMGTPAYMPPEQARSDIHKVHEAADQYSAGVVLYELLTGHVPFEGGPMVVLLHNVINSPPPPPSEFRAGLDARLEAICLKALAKAPEDRYASCRAFADALRKWQAMRGSPGPIAVAALVKPGPKMGTAESTVPSIPKRKTIPPPLPGRTSPFAELEAEADRSVAPSRESVRQKAATTHVVPAPGWETLTDDSSTYAKPQKSGATRKPRLPTGGPKSRKNWLIGGGIAAAVLLLGLVVILAGLLFKVKTPHGTIVLTNVPHDAEVQVEGETVTLTRNGEVVTATAVSEGPHRLKVVKGGQEIWSSDVTVKLGGDQLRLKVEPRNPGALQPPNSIPPKGLPPKGPPHDGPTVDSFVPLFNGKDKTGWKTQTQFKGDWHIENGILVWRSLDSSHLWTERNDYREFHLRIETRISDRQYAQVIVRSSTIQDGYRIVLNSTNPNEIKTGGLIAGQGGPVVKVLNLPVPPNRWFRLEVIAEGNRVIVKVNGQTTADYSDPERRFARGHISLLAMNRDRDGLRYLEFRKIEIKELPPTTEK